MQFTNLIFYDDDGFIAYKFAVGFLFIYVGFIVQSFSFGWMNSLNPGACS